MGSKQLEGSCSHITDSRFHGGGYCTPESRRILADSTRLQNWLDIEVALALAQAELEIIPREAADAIRCCANLDELDLEYIQENIARTGHSLVPLLKALQQKCPENFGEFIHYGATTQDIQDTGQSLEIREVLNIVERDVEALLDQLSSLARQYKDTLMVGRTHAQTALPITFGLKAAGWFDELRRNQERFKALRNRVLVVQLFGGAGTLASFGDKGISLLERFADRLELGVPVTSWHVSRDRIADFVMHCAMLTGTLARIGDEIRTLSRPEIKEVEEGWQYGMLGSSTMPHKRNPEVSEQIVVLSRLVKAQVPVALEAMVVDHERDYRGTRLEWVAVADSSHYTLAALSLARKVLDGLRVHEGTMRERAESCSDAICTERLMLELAPRMGKQSAHQLVYRLSQEALEKQQSLQEILATTEEVTEHLDARTLKDIFNPSLYLGQSKELIERVLSGAV